jgi:hypothetical protein
MKTGCVPGCTESGAISTALIGLAGFAAGALTVALLALTRHPATMTGESARVPTSNSVLHEARPTVNTLDDNRQWPILGEPFSAWPFESATPAPAQVPGKKRPDRLSAPEGWTYQAGERSD